MTDPPLVHPAPHSGRPEDVMFDLYRIVLDVRDELAGTEHAGLVEEVLARHGWHITGSQ